MCSCFAFILATKHRVVLQDRTSTTLWTLKSSLFEGSLPNRTSLDISAETQIVLVHVRQACQMDGSKERKRRFLRLHSSNGFAEAFERLVRAEQKGIKPDEKDRAALRFVLLFFLQCSPGCLFMYVWLRFRDWWRQTNSSYMSIFFDDSSLSICRALGSPGLASSRSDSSRRSSRPLPGVSKVGPKPRVP